MFNGVYTPNLGAETTLRLLVELMGESFFRWRNSIEGIRQLFAMDLPAGMNNRLAG